MLEEENNQQNCTNNNNLTISEKQQQYSKVNNDYSSNTQPSTYLKKIDGSNNSVIYEIFLHSQEQQQQYPQKENNGVSTNLVLKQISHACAHSHSKLKIHRKECQHLKNEVEMVQSLSHDNIINFTNYVSDNQDYCAIVMPKYDCDMFKLLKNYSDKLDIAYIKHMYKQLASALNYLHNEKNIAHNDIKLANLFIKLKQVSMTLADFGFAKEQTEKNAQEQKERWATRTLQYMAPELINQKSEEQPQQYYCEKVADVFSFGINLFQSIFLISPFEGDGAVKEDPMFNPFYTGEIMNFWKNPKVIERLQVLQQKQGINLSQLMDLLTKCFQVNPADRISAADLLQHAWFQQQQC